jgi:hypothetical protein
VYTSTYVYRFRPLCCCLLGLLQRTALVNEARRGVGGWYIEQRALRPYEICRATCTSYALGPSGALGSQHGHAAMGGREGAGEHMHCCRANVMIITFARNIRTTTQHRRAAADGQHAARAAPPPSSARNMKWAFAPLIRARRNVSATVHLPLQQHPPRVPRPVLSTSSLRSGFLTRLLGLAFGTRLCETRPRRSLLCFDLLFIVYTHPLAR